jgi:hypothetical protein
MKINAGRELGFLISRPVFYAYAHPHDVPDICHHQNNADLGIRTVQNCSQPQACGSD